MLEGLRCGRHAQTFAGHRLDAIVFPTTPRVAIASNPESSSLENFGLFIQNTDPGSNAGIPGIQIPIGLGGDQQIADRARAGWPGRQRRAAACDWCRA